MSGSEVKQDRFIGSKATDVIDFFLEELAEIYGSKSAAIKISISNQYDKDRDKIAAFKEHIRRRAST